LQSLPTPTSYTPPKETAAILVLSLQAATGVTAVTDPDVGRSLCAEDCGEWLAV